MRIGFIATRLAGVDGVSLETEKLVHVLERRGHECFYIAGELQDGGTQGVLVPEMHFKHPTAQAHHDAAFQTASPPASLFREIFEMADYLRERLDSWVRDNNIELIISQNASTIPMNLALGVAIRDLVERTRIPLICHNHDFYWERERFLVHGIGDILDTAFPPDLEPVRHLVISTIAKRELYSRRGIRATYTPNVFDFQTPPPEPDSYTQSFRHEVGLSDDDIIILQPTRVVRRKAIEKAIELVKKLNDERVILLITGYEGDETGGYGEWLLERAAQSGIRYKFIADYVDDVRGEHNGHKVFTLWDIYPHARLITYPSVIEGFGNALIETVYFRKPFVVHTYPVYLADIRTAGIKAVEFHYDITDEVVAQTRQLLDDDALCERIVEHNYQIGLKHFSYETLENTLEQVINDLMPR
ncbi:MAG: glycosyltransferase [Chloroflexi bacterium]|nr:MAG: glycosyltransferase [Chloroflexota bacterium]